jgi:hypothetical protein
MSHLGIKHLIECHCTLKIYQKKSDIQDHLYHKFCVYSQVDKDTGRLVEKIVKCNNCGTLHKVYDYCKSFLVKKENENYEVGIDIDDIKVQLDDKIVRVLEKYQVDISTWEHVLDIYDKQVWGSQIVLTRNLVEQKYHVKILQVVDNKKIKILTKVIEDEINFEG